MPQTARRQNVLRFQRPEPILSYFATAGTEMIDVGPNLDELLIDLGLAFSELEGDVAVWEEGDGEPRLVAVMKPGKDGVRIVNLDK